MRKITAAMAVVRAWIAAIWPWHEAQELARQYKVAAALLRQQCPLVLADLAKFGLANDTTFDDANPHLSSRNQGRREFWLYLQAAFALSDEDLAAIKYATENDDGRRNDEDNE